MKTAICMFCAMAALVAGVAVSRADEIQLVEDGVAKCRVVLAPDASKPERFAGEELARYLAKVTGCGELNGAYPIYVKVKVLPSLKEDGFAIEVSPEKMTIVGQNPRGALYGCYEVLKKFAGMRWLVPGDDGEYFTPKKTVTAPIGRTVSNPHLSIRESRCDDDMAGHYWHARNNMLSRESTSSFFDKNGRLTDRGEALERLAVRGCAISGHLMSLLLIGSNNKEAGEKLFAEHPEYFPEIGGRRVLSYAHNSPNPCVSNPEVLDRMAAELVRRLGVPHGNDAYCEIANNDTTTWCECANCRALDPPEAAGTRGQRSDRYWYMMNELAKRVFRSLPGAKLCGGPYQDFWFAPVRVKPDPRLYVFVSFNNQCWRHSICDPKCSVNKVMRNIFDGWKKWNMPLVFNRDEIGAYDGWGSPGCEFQPVESVLAKNFAEYPEIACNGSHLCVYGPVPLFKNISKKTSPYYGTPYHGKSYHWYAMWQGAYVAALTMWNPNADWRSELEVANRHFYGAAWDGGMRDFRRLLEKCFFETPGCIGWGQGAPMGRCLDAAGSEDRLKALLEKALAVAKASGDARAERNVAREKEIFELTWLVQRKKYLENFQELNVYRRTAPIVVDGEIDEADWKNADAISDFRVKPLEPAAVKTYARVTYDEDNLYVAVECMEPAPGKIVGRIPGAGETDVHVLGDRVELFYNFPDMADAAFHLCINSKGGIIAARQNSTSDRRDFKSSARFATKVHSDRWALEIAIPCSEIGSKCFDGATWKLNVARERFVEGMARTDSSSCCKGAFHGPANFMNIKFTPCRVKGIGQGNDTSSWKNSSLDKHQKRDKRWPYPKFRCEEFMQPVGWNPMDVVGSYQRHPGSDSNWYVTLEYGPGANLRQYYRSRDAVHLKAFFRARGKGRLNLWTGGFETTPDGKDYNFKKGQEKLFSYDLTPEWKTYTAEVDKAATPIDRVMFKFYVDNGSVADIDDCVVSPQGGRRSDERVSRKSGGNWLQDAVDIKAAAGGGEVVVPAGVYEFCPFELKSGVALRLEKGARLLASTNICDYPVRDGSPVLIGAYDATNVAIVGEGVIDGRGGAFREKEPLPGESQPQSVPVMMRFSRCRGVKLEGFTYRDGAAWGLHLRNCDGVEVRRVKAFNHANQANDGIDIESRNVLVEDCDLDTDDDALVFKSESDSSFDITNVVVRNCRFASCCNAIKFGTGSYGLWRDVEIRDCVVERAGKSWRFDWRRPSEEWPFPCGGFPKPMPGVTNAVTGLAAIALEVVDGGRMENVRVRNIDIRSGFQTPIFVRMERRHPPRDGYPTFLQNVLIENVRGTAESRIACSITGLPSLRPTGVTLRNVELRFPGGGTAEEAAKVPRECETDYPDNYMFDQEALPAWGFYIRHADDIRFENVRLSLDSPDARPEVIRDDVNGFSWYNTQVAR